MNPAKTFIFNQLNLKLLETLVKFNGLHKAILGKGKPLGDPPKTWKRLGVGSHGIGDIFNPDQFKYNSNLVTIYQARDKSLRYEIYRDGCFYPFYGHLTLIAV